MSITSPSPAKAAINAQVISIKGAEIILAYHPESYELTRGETLLLIERGAAADSGVVAQVIEFHSAGYPGDNETSLHELLEATIADRLDLIQREPGLSDLKEIKLAKLQIRKSYHRGLDWLPWIGHIPSRNVTVEPVSNDELLRNVLPPRPSHPVIWSTCGDLPVVFDARDFDKVNVLVGNKGTGKSHTAKHNVVSLTAHGAPVVVLDINREFTELPGADVIRIGDNYKLSLTEVGFPFVMALIDDMNPLTEVSRGAFEHNGPRFMSDQIARTGFATIDYLHEQAERGRFHNNDMVNGAIEMRLRMLKNTKLFETNPDAPTLSDKMFAAASDNGFIVLDLAEQPMGRLRALTRGILRRLESICEQERRDGTGRYPFVFFEEAHMYTAPAEILNLITRGRHLGLTLFFMTNSPSELPEVVFRQLDNLIVTGLSHSADLRLIARSALSDENTLQSLATGLGRTAALVIGRITDNYPLLVSVSPLPEGFPATGATRSFWGR